MRFRLATALFFAAVAFAPGAFAQQICPGDTGEALLTCLRANYTPTNVRSYAGARNALFGTVDNIGGTVEGVYTGATITVNPNGSDPHGEAFGKGMNTEHSFPQSKGTGNEPARADLHHLFPSLQNVNSARGSLPFAEIDDAQTDDWYRGTSRTGTAPPLAERDEYSERGNGRFEPREIKEGDIARAIFYIATIYEGTVSSSFFEGQVDDLLTWHAADPADAAEVARSGRAKGVQGNDNPFVLDATLAQRAFGDGTVVTVATFTSVQAEVQMQTVRLTWATSSETNNTGFDVEQSKDGGAFATVAFVEGSGTTSVAQTYGLTFTGVAPGTYAFRLRAKDGDGNETVSPPAGATVDGPPPTATVVEDFAASASGRTISVTWRTTAEFEAASFRVEQSGGGGAFAEVAQVDAQGTTNDDRDYARTIAGVEPGTYTIRLVEVKTGGERLTQGEASVTVEEGQTGDGLGVFISEIHEPSSFPGEFVELYNAGTAPVDLDGWTLTQANSSKLTTLNSASLQAGSLTLAPGAYAVVGRGSAAQFADIFGSLPTTYFSEGDSDTQGAPQINGDETYVLADASSTQIDTFAPPGGFDAANDRYQRLAYPNEPGTSAAAWLADSTPGTPGEANAVSALARERADASAVGFTLGAAHPNPFGTRTQLALTVAAPVVVEAAAYDLLGRRVAALHSGPAYPGTPLVLTLGAADLAAGSYLVRVRVGGTSATRLVTLAR